MPEITYSLTCILSPLLLRSRGKCIHFYLLFDFSVSSVFYSLLSVFPCSGCEGFASINLMNESSIVSPHESSTLINLSHNQSHGSSQLYTITHAAVLYLTPQVLQWGWKLTKDNMPRVVIYTSNKKVLHGQGASQPNATLKWAN